MAKVRVYELAKELGLESKELLSTLNEMGEFVRSASSTIEAPVVRRVTEKVKGVHKDAKSGAVDHAPAPKKSGAPAPKPKTSATPQTPQPDAPQAAAGAKVGPRATPGPHPVPGPRAVPGPRPTPGQHAAPGPRQSNGNGQGGQALPEQARSAAAASQARCQ